MQSKGLKIALYLTNTISMRTIFIVQLLLIHFLLSSGNILQAKTGLLDPPSITGMVFIDIDYNGTFDLGTDRPLKNVTVLAYPDCDESNPPFSTKTDANGAFSFEGILSWPPTNKFLILIDPNGKVACDAYMQCLTIEPQQTEVDPILFGCQIPDCTSNPSSVDNYCQDALDNPQCDLRLLQDWPCSQIPSQLGPWTNQAIGSSTGDGFQNTSFYSFIAGTGNYSINFTIFQCVGSGVQYGILDGVCDPNGPYVIFSDTASTGNISIPSSLLTPCKKYILWIDGFEGSVCSYYAFLTGRWENCSLLPIKDIKLDFNCKPLCPSYEAITINAIPEKGVLPDSIDEAIIYWDITDPNGLTYNYTLEGPDGWHLDYVFHQEGTYEICITPHHTCNQSGQTYCKEFTFAPLKKVYQKFNVCIDDFPWHGAFNANGDPTILDPYGNYWAWQGGEISLDMVRSGQKNYVNNIISACGCNYEQHFTITPVYCLDVPKFPADEVILFQVSPNPTNSSFRVSDGTLGHYQITDITGRLVYQGAINSSDDEINIQHLPDGMYFMNIEGKFGRIVKEMGP